MRIAVIRRGNGGGGLARLWREAGHDGPTGGQVAKAFNTNLARLYERLGEAHETEDFLAVIFAVSRAGTGPFVYRFAPPGDL
jgi:hypothetical protein